MKSTPILSAIPAFGRVLTAGFALVMLTAAPANAQDEAVDVDALWEQYDVQATRFEEVQVECDEGDIATTRVNRLCREAADTSLALADTIESLLAHDDALTEDDRELLIDGMLTNRQIGGALWVELGECETGRTILQQLLAHPDLPDRPVVQQAAENWIDRADACVAAMTAVEPVADGGGNGRVAPIVVMSSGLAVLAGGVAWDLALGGERSDFESLHAACSAGCSTEQFADLNDSQETLENAKVPIAVLYGAGAAIAVGGAIWLALSGDDADVDAGEVSFAPIFTRGGAGASVTVGF